MFMVSSSMLFELVLFGRGGLRPFVDRKFVDLDFSMPSGTSSLLLFCKMYIPLVLFYISGSIRSSPASSTTLSYSSYTTFFGLLFASSRSRVTLNDIDYSESSSGSVCFLFP